MESIYCTYEILSRLNKKYNDNRDLAPAMQNKAERPKVLRQEGIDRPKVIKKKK
jgi:hypothetical protein